MKHARKDTQDITPDDTPGDRRSAAPSAKPSPQAHISSRRFSYNFAKLYGLIVLEEDAAENVPDERGVRVGRRCDDTLTGNIAVSALLEARRVVGMPLEIIDMPADQFERRLSEIYSMEGISADDLQGAGAEDLTRLAEGLPQTADLLENDDDAPVIRLINALIAEAVTRKASDIHVEPYEHELSIRLRVDGVLAEVLCLPARMTPVLTSRVKVMARLDIAEQRTPQDGRISLAMGNKSIDIRVSTLPSRFGERVVMRLLDKENARLDLDRLGMPTLVLERYKDLLARPNGIILVTGPTGSGKTTTLYGGLTLLNDPSRNILTVEDPVEYALDNIGQTQVNSKVGMTFAAGLRAILRQDPDVVMVGEIRDVETAQIAVQASLTGHLVLSTVHTNSSIGAITRLRDMGVEPFLLSSTIAGMIAQRLVRRLCVQCKTPQRATTTQKNILGVCKDEELTIYQPNGCTACARTGYDGRIGLYDLVVVDDTLKAMIHDNASEQKMAAYAFTSVPNLSQCGFAHVCAGVTALEEVLRVAHQGKAL